MPPKSDLWKHVLEKSKPDASGNVDMQCLYCGLEFSGGANRIMHHLACSGGAAGVSTCSEVSEELQQLCKTRIEQSALAKQKKSKLSALSGKRAYSDSEVQIVAPPEKKQASVKSFFGQEAKREVDRAVARFAYATGTPFNRLTSPYFDKMLQAVAAYGPHYKKPSIKALRGPLLCEERARVERELQAVVLDCLADTAATLASDGWSSTDNRPLLNVMLVTPKGACFRQAVDTSGQTKARL